VLGKLLDPSIDLAKERTGKWAENEDIKLKDAVQTHGGKNWIAITAQVPGRTRNQCWHRWHDVLDPNIDRTPPGRTGKWVEDEDIQLKDAVQTNGGKNWVAISSLVPGRTKQQCCDRWKIYRDPNRSTVRGK
jgi:Myb-like DNA-binding protein BAS1